MIKHLFVGLVAATLWYALLPTNGVVLPASPGVNRDTRGVVHVHTRRSDGTGTLDQVAAAARRAGLAFVIVTDHGDASREPDPPSYRDGVLVIDGVEISTRDGHLVAIGLPQSPYPLGGEARDVVADVHRMGGLAFAAHPASARGELAWHDWEAPVDGLEWLNADSEWRDETRLTLARALLTYPGRPTETIAALFDRPDEVLARWDVLNTTRPVVGYAASDAHARIGLRSLGEPFDNGLALSLPSYETVFRAFSVRLPETPLTGKALPDAAAVIGAFRDGRVYSALDAAAQEMEMQFSATSGASPVHMGGTIALDTPVTLGVRVHGPSDARIVLFRAGREVASSAAPTLEHVVTDDAGAYRVEVQWGQAPGQPPVPVLVSNAIHVGRQAPPTRPAERGPTTLPASVRVLDDPAMKWSVEQSPRSLAALDILRPVTGVQIAFRFALGGGMAESPFAALALRTATDFAEHTGLTFTARASRPLRASVQLRTAGSEGSQRWQRSVYLDQSVRTVYLRFGDLRPVAQGQQRSPQLSEIESVLFVVDTTNAVTGHNGEIVLEEVGYWNEAR